MSEEIARDEIDILIGGEGKNLKRRSSPVPLFLSVIALLLSGGAFWGIVHSSVKSEAQAALADAQSRRMNVLLLEDQAIAEKNRSAFRALRGMIEDESLAAADRTSARASVNRIELFYLQSAPLVQSPIRFLETPDGRQEIPDDGRLPLDVLTTTLQTGDASWQLRARAAFLLGKHNDLQAVASLTEAVRTEENLSVLYFATQSLNQITGAGYSRVFGETDLVEWVEKNQDRLSESLLDSRPDK
jgi:hypothetical protein